jgi:hypothetical protein
MFNKIKGFAGEARGAISKTVVLLGDLNGDGKVDEEDARIAAEWAREKAVVVGNEASRLWKEAMQSSLAKAAAMGAGIGAVIAVPVPVVGPITGAAIGAGLGVYRNLTKANRPTPVVAESSPASVDVHAELLKLDELRRKKIITAAEFRAQKKKILDQ